MPIVDSCQQCCLAQGLGQNLSNSTVGAKLPLHLEPNPSLCHPSSKCSPLSSCLSSTTFPIFFISAENCQTYHPFSFLPKYLPGPGPDSFSYSIVLIPLTSHSSSSTLLLKCCPRNRTHSPSSGLLPFCLLVSLLIELPITYAGHFGLPNCASSIISPVHLPSGTKSY